MRFFILFVVVSCAWLYVAKTNNTITMKIKRIRLEPNSKLSGRKLSGVNLESIDLSGSDLSDANLEFARLNGADLSHVNLENANLSQANLSGAKLCGANLKNCQMFGVRFTSGFAEFGKVTRQADLSNVDLREARLTATIWSHGEFQGIDLSHSVLDVADFSSANLRGAKLTNAKLIRAKLIFADCTDVDLRWANLNEADLSNTIFTRANFSKANLTGAKLISASFYKADFSGAITNGIKIYEDQLDGMLNVDLSRAEVYDRKSKKKILSKNQSHTKDEGQITRERYVPAQAPAAKNPIATSFHNPDEYVVLRVRKEVDEYVRQIKQLRGSDMDFVFRTRTEQQRTLDLIQEIADKALVRAVYIYKDVSTDPLVFSKEDVMEQIGIEFQRISQAMSGRD